MAKISVEIDEEDWEEFKALIEARKKEELRNAIRNRVGNRIAGGSFSNFLSSQSVEVLGDLLKIIPVRIDDAPIRPTGARLQNTQPTPTTAIFIDDLVTTDDVTIDTHGTIFPPVINGR